MKSLTVWASPIDIYAVRPTTNHSVWPAWLSNTAWLERIHKEAIEDFGDGTTLEKVSDDQYKIRMGA